MVVMRIDWMIFLKSTYLGLCSCKISNQLEQFENFDFFLFFYFFYDDVIDSAPPYCWWWELIGWYFCDLHILVFVHAKFEVDRSILKIFEIFWGVGLVLGGGAGEVTFILWLDLACFDDDVVVHHFFFTCFFNFWHHKFFRWGHPLKGHITTTDNDRNDVFCIVMWNKTYIFQIRVGNN